jgi:hypothetical protein
MSPLHPAPNPSTPSPHLHFRVPAPRFYVNLPQLSSLKERTRMPSRQACWARRLGTGIAVLVGLTVLPAEAHGQG